MTKDKIELGIWAVISVSFFLIIAFVEVVLSIIFMFELHMNSSAPGDFAFTECSIILKDIAIYLGVPILINIGIIIYWYLQTRRLFDPPILSQRVSHRAALTLCLIGALILNGHLIYSSASYWQERAPFFDYKPNSP